MKLPWQAKTEEEDPFWDFFVNSAPSDDKNWLGSALRNAPEGVVNPVKEDIHTPEIMSRHVKELGHYLGAELMAVAKTDLPDYPYAVLVGMRAKYDPRTSPGIGGQLPVQKALYVTFIMSAWIREMGYQGTTKNETNAEELAVKAGMGTLGADGRLVSSQLGKLHVSNPILTDLPVQADG